ncbi:hypothetical protein [Burkholderia cenocepacia]|uniref:hypothetical protein n=1 Tax=Burkholderia latens TaxID=488446 RepID=UPI000A7CAC5A
MRAHDDALRDRAHSDTATNESRAQASATVARSRSEPVPFAGRRFETPEPHVARV